MKFPFKAFAMATLSAVTLFAGDLTITFNAKTKVMGMNTEGIETHYYSPNFQMTANSATKTDTLTDYAKGIYYTIKHKDKKIELMTFEDLVAIGEAASKQLEGMAEMPAFMKNMMGGGDPGEVKVEPLGPDTVTGRACKKYKLTCGKLVNDLSLDPTLKLPINPAAFAKFQKLRGNMIPGAGGASMKKLYAELSKLQGVALKVRMTGLMGMDSTQEATKVSTDAIPAATFALPEGYKTEDTGKKMLKDSKSR